MCVDSAESVGVTVWVLELYSAGEAELVLVEAQLLESLFWSDQTKTLHPGETQEGKGRTWGRERKREQNTGQQEVTHKARPKAEKKQLELLAYLN